MKTKIPHIFALSIILGLLTACGGGSGDDTSDDENTNVVVEPDADFLAKAKAVNLQQIKLYPGHIDASSRKPAELDPSNLESGDLITVEIIFEAIENINDYALSARLIPQALFPLIKDGSTLSEVVDLSSTEVQDIELVELSGTYLSGIDQGVTSAFIQTKLPILEQPAIFKVVVTPAIEFLSSNKPVNDSEAEIIPVLIDSRELVINKLEAVSIKLASVPVLAKDNDFTELETAASIGSNGFTEEPLFQTFIDVDVTSFNDAETVILEMNFLIPGGGIAPLGLLGTDALGKTEVALEAQFEVKRSEENSSRLPVVVFAPPEAQQLLLKFATKLRDIADKPVIDGHFQLTISVLENGAKVSTGPALDLFLPLVSQQNRFQLQSVEQASGYTLLRAGSTNANCLSISVDIDLGVIFTDSSSNIQTQSCITSPPDTMLWRYEASTKQFISKAKDEDNNNYCITINALQVNTGGGSGSSAFNREAKLEKCIVPSPFTLPALNSTQTLSFEGNKIKSKLGYLQVGTGDSGFTQLIVVEQSSAAADFFRDNNGVELDDSGRLFYIGKFLEHGWGSEDLAKVSLSYGAESYMDYMPVIGNTNQGHFILSFALFDFVQTDIINIDFGLQRYFTKKISFTGGNSPDVVVGNGAFFHLDSFGITILPNGEIKKTTVSQTFDPLNDLGNVILPAITIEPKDPLFAREIDEEFFEKTIMVWIIPVTIAGGLEGTLDINYALTTPDLSAAASITQEMSLAGYLKASVIGIAGITGTIEAINQKLTFAANAGFTMNNLEPKLTLGAGSSLLHELNLLKGEVDAFVKYRSPFSFKVKEKTVNLYSSAYLFNNNWTLFNKDLGATVVEY